MAGPQLVVVDADAERVQRVCASLPGAIGFTNLDDALDEIDAAVVATPPTTHAPMAMRLIEAGKHVLVEKPMAADSADARRMIAAAAAGFVLGGTLGSRVAGRLRRGPTHRA